MVYVQSECDRNFKFHSFLTDTLSFSKAKYGSWLWLSWQSSCSQYPRSPVRIQSFAKFYSEHVLLLTVEKTKIKKKGPIYDQLVVTWLGFSIICLFPIPVSGSKAKICSLLFMLPHSVIEFVTFASSNNLTQGVPGEPNVMALVYFVHLAVPALSLHLVGDISLSDLRTIAMLFHEFI